MSKDKIYLVQKYHLSCFINNHNYEYDILAVNSDWALTFIDRKTDYESITLTKISGVIALASFGARDITGLSESEYLYYHAEPFYS